MVVSNERISNQIRMKYIAIEPYVIIIDFNENINKNRKINLNEK